MARLSPLGVAISCLGCVVPLLAASVAESERNNWVVIVETSKYWYNYRHTTNVLSVYHTVKRLGIPDSQIILMMAEDMPCNPRNTKPGMVFHEQSQSLNLYGEDVEVDYRGDEVTVENFIRVLTGRHAPNTPRNKRLLTDSASNVLVYITGHSGEEFIKFQDWEEMTSNDIADAFQQMHKQRRYGKVFWISDTCQAASLQNKFYSPGIIAIGSSSHNESSYSHHMDSYIGVALVDRFTYYATDYFNQLKVSSDKTIAHFKAYPYFTYRHLNANPQMRTDLFPQRAEETKMTEFFASTGRMRFQSTVLTLQGSRATSPRPSIVETGALLSSALSPTSDATKATGTEDLFAILASSAPEALDGLLRRDRPSAVAFAGAGSEMPSRPELAMGASGLWLLAFLGVAGASSLAIG